MKSTNLTNVWVVSKRTGTPTYFKIEDYDLAIDCLIRSIRAAAKNDTEIYGYHVTQGFIPNELLQSGII